MGRIRSLLACSISRAQNSFNECHNIFRGNQCGRGYPYHCLVRDASSLASSWGGLQDSLGWKSMRFPASFFTPGWNMLAKSLLCHSLLRPSYSDKRGFCQAAITEKDSDANRKKKRKKKKSEGAIGLDMSSKTSHSDDSSSSFESNEDFSDVPKIFRALLASNIAGNMPVTDRQTLTKIFRLFAGGGWAKDHAVALYISPSFFASACTRFKKFFMHRCYPTLRRHLIALERPEASDRFLFLVFTEFCSHEFPAETARYRALVSTADLTKPHTWYPFARAIRRKVIYHCGPTNSGKTYSALSRFMEASSGIYCSPLRLLAMEVFEKVNADGVYCTLVTGQERKEVPFSQHLACTIEMASTQLSWEVAIIDEVQMLSDEFRGWAWTRAFLGLQADEIHVCGDPSALTLVRNLCVLTGDTLEEITYERFKPLTVDSQSLEGEYKNVQPGDCIVAFSRREIFFLKEAIERATENRCCVIYGSLPPETRTEQARLFNDPKSGFNVLIASDAVGMGLNLNIRRVVFYSVNKFNGEKRINIPPSHVKQVAGRAGRRGCLYPEGITTTFFAADVEYLRESLQAPYAVAQSAGLFPALEQMEVFASQMSNVTFTQLLDRFCETCLLDGSYFLCRNDHIKKVSYVIDGIKDLSFEDRFRFCFVPVQTRDPNCMKVLSQFATAYSKRESIFLPVKVPSRSATNEMELQDLETRHHITSMYLWLGQHFPDDFFPETEEAELIASEIAVLLGQSLAQTLGMSVKIFPSKNVGKICKRKSGLKQVNRGNKTSKLVDVLVSALKVNRPLA